jgi:mono/diheme cytochrome c family protein
MKSTTKYFLNVLASAFIAMSMINCSPRKSLPIAGPVSMNEREKEGEKIFMEHCQRCHPQGEAGLGPGIHWAPGFAKKFQVRHGVGAMPAFGDEHISDKELNQLMEYLKAMKQNS